MKEMVHNGSEVRPGSVRACDTCPVGPQAKEKYFSPLNIFSMGFDQAVLPPEERRGVRIARASLLTREDVVTADPASEDGEVVWKDYLLPYPLEILRHAEMPAERWDAVAATVCNSPEQGRRTHLLFGPHRKECPILKSILAEATRDAAIDSSV